MEIPNFFISIDINAGLGHPSVLVFSIPRWVKPALDDEAVQAPDGTVVPFDVPLVVFCVGRYGILRNHLSLNV